MNDTKLQALSLAIQTPGVDATFAVGVADIYLEYLSGQDDSGKEALPYLRSLVEMVRAHINGTSFARAADPRGVFVALDNAEAYLRSISSEKTGEE